MQDHEYFSHLYEIARQLNREYSLHSALKKSLEKIVDLLELETGWIWLAQPDIKSVYLAASYNLPPALSKHPERLSGWCYCIKKYLSDEMEKADNISEITCTRFKDISSGTKDLKFHASIPISANGQKFGLLNLLSKETQQLDDKKLSILNTVSELIAIAIQRTHTQASYGQENQSQDSQLKEIIERVIHSKVIDLDSVLIDAKESLHQNEYDKASKSIEDSLNTLGKLKEQLQMVLNEKSEGKDDLKINESFHYPSSPLTKRELEVLSLVKKGFPNKQIADQLFISERTVKFHMSSIFSKLYARTRTEAVEIAMQRGLIGL